MTLHVGYVDENSFFETALLSSDQLGEVSGSVLGVIVNNLEDACIGAKYEG